MDRWRIEHDISECCWRNGAVQSADQDGYRSLYADAARWKHDGWGNHDEQLGILQHHADDVSPKHQRQSARFSDRFWIGQVHGNSQHRYSTAKHAKPDTDERSRSFGSDHRPKQLPKLEYRYHFYRHHQWRGQSH